MPQSLYDILELTPAADHHAIRQSYRRKAKRLHPDMPNGNAVEFSKLAHAVAVLTDPDRRARYDQTGQDEAPPENAALALVVQKFVTAFVQHFERGAPNPAQVDLVALIKGAFKQEIAQCKLQQKMLRDRAVKWKAYTKRFLAAGRGLILKRALENQAAELERQAAALDTQLALRRDALLLLDDCSFDMEQTLQWSIIHNAAQW